MSKINNITAYTEKEKYNQNILKNDNDHLEVLSESSLNLKEKILKLTSYKSKLITENMHLIESNEKLTIENQKLKAIVKHFENEGPSFSRQRGIIIWLN